MEGTFKGHLVQHPCSKQSHLQLDQTARSPVTSNLTLNVSRDGVSTTSLGNLFQCFATLIVKNFFLRASLNLPSFSLKPLLLVLSQQTLPKKQCTKTSSFWKPSTPSVLAYNALNVNKQVSSLRLWQDVP